MTAQDGPRGVPQSGPPAGFPGAGRDPGADLADRRWLQPLAAAALAAVAVSSSLTPPRAGLHGASLGLTLALGGFVAGVISVRSLIIVRRRRTRAWLPALVLLAVSAGGLAWLQPSGPGQGLAIGAAVILAARLVPARFTTPALIACVVLGALTLITASAARQHGRQAPGLLGGLLPSLGVLLLAALIWRYRLREERTRQRVALLALTRDAELRAAALAERQRVARDMHDILAHSLSGLVVQLEGARLLAASHPGDTRLPGLLTRAHGLAQNGLDEARQAIGMLRGDELPSPDRLSEAVREFEADTGIPCPLTVDGTPRELGSAVRLALYRVAQEALTNIRKHARPDRAQVRLEYRPDTVRLSVEDFGGAPAAAGYAAPGPGGYGLAGMRERAELLGGTLSAGPAAAGFAVRMEVPA